MLHLIEKGSVVVFADNVDVFITKVKYKEKIKFIMSTYFHFLGVDSRLQIDEMDSMKEFILLIQILFSFTNGETQTISIEKSMD